MMLSRMVSHRRESARLVVKAARRHMGRVGIGVAELLGPEPGRAAEVLMGAWADRLERATQSMISSDEAQNGSDWNADVAMRKQCDEAAVEIRGVLMGLRDLAGIMFGADYVRILGFLGSTPEDPVLLRRLGNRVLGKVDNEEPPPSRVEGMSFDPEPWKERIGVPLEKLDVALDKMALEALEKEQALGAKRRAVAVHDAMLQKSGVLISALLSITGEEEVAEHVQSVSTVPGPIFDPGASSEPYDEPTLEGARDTVPSGAPRKKNRLSKWFGAGY